MNTENHEITDSIKKDSSKMSKCYQYFYNRLFESTEDEFNNILKNMLVSTYNFFIVITTEKENDDEAQKIFNSINTLGVRLTSADIIKNWIFDKLMDSLTEVEVTKFYEKTWATNFNKDNETTNFWHEIKSYGKEKLINLEEFLKDYAIIKRFYKSSSLSLVDSYKNKIKDFNSDQIKEFVIDLCDYASSYKKMLDDFEEYNSDIKFSDFINSTLLIFNLLDNSVFTPVILYFYKEKPQDYEKVLHELQKFVLDAILFNSSIKNFNKNAEQLLDFEQYSANTMIDLLKGWTKTTNHDSFPLGVLSIINKNAKALLFLIEMIRRKNSDESNYTLPLVWDKRFQLEHIMPQEWATKWSSVDCFDYKDGNFIQITDINKVNEVRNNKVYSLGNMIILKDKLNKSISNKDFKTKIDGDNVSGKKGIKEFVKGLSVSEEIIPNNNESQEWNEKNIFNRELALFEELNKEYNFVDINKVNLKRNVLNDKE